MGKVIFITSFKGGVGKTTVSANLAGVLSVQGKKVLAVDGDFGMRCMDIVLGLENSTLYDAYDVISGRCALANALTIHPENENLSFLPAPMSYSGEPIDEARVKKLFISLKRKYDYILIDSSADPTLVYKAFAKTADVALIVSLHQASSIRAAEKTALSLGQYGIKDTRLVINQFRFNAAEKNLLPKITEIIARTSVRLIGVIPYDGKLPIDQEYGVLAFSKQERKKHFPYEIAFNNIAQRINGIPVALLTGLYSQKKKERDLY